MPDDLDQREPLSESTILNRLVPGIPASAHKNETDLGLDGSWQQPWGSTGWGFQAMIVKVNNLSTTADLLASFDGGTTEKRVSPGETYTFTRRNDDGHAFVIKGTASEPYEIDIEK